MTVSAAPQMTVSVAPQMTVSAALQMAMVYILPMEMCLMELLLLLTTMGTAVALPLELSFVARSSPT